MKICRQIVYSGRVQGIGFRYSVKQIATGFDVTGWVRNLADGTVEMQAAGDPAELEAFLSAIATSHLARYVKDTQQSESELVELTASGFEIRH